MDTRLSLVGPSSIQIFVYRVRKGVEVHFSI